jgi:hypothetical protein
MKIYEDFACAFPVSDSLCDIDLVPLRGIHLFFRIIASFRCMKQVAKEATFPALKQKFKSGRC